MTVTAQWIRTSWTKQSRGGAAATLRNAAPIGFPLPIMGPSSAHVVRMHERDGFVPEQESVELKSLEVQLRVVDGRVRVMPQAPAFPPQQRRPPAVWLEAGQWVRWQRNYRVGGAQDWSYWLDTFNIACGSVEHDAFLGEPTVSVDERGWLR